MLRSRTAIRRSCAVFAAAAISLGSASAALASTDTTTPTDDTSMSDASMPMDTTMASSTGTATEGGGPTGPLCAAVPAEGAGSVTGMAQDPVATAAGNNPLLSTLVAAVTAANLGETLNGPGPYTVLAPINSAFDKIDPATLEAALADPEMLTSILTFHVLEGTHTAADLAAAGSMATLNGAEVTFSMVNETLVVNGGAAAVQCADVATANATVFLIDSVLMPPA